MRILIDCSGRKKGVSAAKVDGVVALHLHYGNRREWTVTHIPTGYALGHFEDRTAAKQYFDACVSFAKKYPRQMSRKTPAVVAKWLRSNPDAGR